MHFCEEVKGSRKKRFGKGDLTKLASQINVGSYQRLEGCVYALQDPKAGGYLINNMA